MLPAKEAAGDFADRCIAERRHCRRANRRGMIKAAEEKSGWRSFGLEAALKSGRGIRITNSAEAPYNALETLSQ